MLPQFNGVLEQYWGRNFFKLHTEYLGRWWSPWPAWASATAARSRLVRALGVIARAVPPRRARRSHAVLPAVVRSDADDEEGSGAGHGVLPGGAADGGLRRVRGRPAAAARGLAAGRWRSRSRCWAGSRCWAPSVCSRVWPRCWRRPSRRRRSRANAGDMRRGALRLLLVVAVSGGVFWAVWAGEAPSDRRGRRARRHRRGRSVERRPTFLRLQAAGSASSSPTTRSPRKLGQEPKPFRVLDAGVYPGSVLMAYSIQSVLGYHGTSALLRRAARREERVAQLGNPNLHDLLAVRYLLLPDSQAVPGFHPVAGPTTTTARGGRRAVPAGQAAGLRAGRAGGREAA